MTLLKRKRILVPLCIICMLIAAYAQKASTDTKAILAGKLPDKDLNEVSGMVASTTHPGIYYVHNDSGDTSRFFAITPEGKLKATYYFKGEKIPFGVTDCEDIADGPGPIKGKSYVYLGDIGDNNSSRKYIAIYRFEEPANVEGTSTIPATTLFLKYPDGPKDAETLMLDPVDRLLYVVSKRKDSVSIYTTPLVFKANDTVTLTKRASIHFTGFPPFKWITAGDISKDGTQILLKNYQDVYYWKRTPGEPVWKVMTGKPSKLYYRGEKQGESIAFTPDGKGYYTTGEGLGEPIYFYHVAQ